MIRNFGILFVLLITANITWVLATPKEARQESSATCIVAHFSHRGSEHWQNVTLSLSNQCSAPINIDGIIVEFEDSQDINDIWYSHAENTAYPEISLSKSPHLYSLTLAFPHHSAGLSAQLMPQKTVTLNYGTRKVGYFPDSVKVTLNQVGRKIADARTEMQGALNTAEKDVQKPADTEELDHFPWSKLAVGRVIGYLPLNWNNSGSHENSIPSPRDLATAGYTHILVSFGVFSTDSSCAIKSTCILLLPESEQLVHVSSGDGSVKQPLKRYIDQLHQSGIKVLLSIGGAATSYGTVDFQQSFNRVQNGQLSFDTTVGVYVTSLNRLIQQYGFDGIDVDIEHGMAVPTGRNLLAAGSRDTCIDGFEISTGLAPAAGGVCAVAAIIQQLVKQRADLTITLAPQTLNIAANNQMGGQILNYSSLIANVREHLTWVGVQVYNSGGMYGPAGTLQPITAKNQVNASVAMALNLLQPWNQAWPNFFLDNSTAILRPNQVVLGYPASNGHDSDGLPTGELANIKHALICLNQGHYCDPALALRNPTTPIGGVFNWNVNFDRANRYAFAKTISGR